MSTPAFAQVAVMTPTMLLGLGGSRSRERGDDAKGGEGGDSLAHVFLHRMRSLLVYAPVAFFIPVENCASPMRGAGDLESGEAITAHPRTLCPGNDRPGSIRGAFPFRDVALDLLKNLVE